MKKIIWTSVIAGIMQIQAGAMELPEEETAGGGSAIVAYTETLSNLERNRIQVQEFMNDLRNQLTISNNRIEKLEQEIQLLKSQKQEPQREVGEFKFGSFGKYRGEIVRFEPIIEADGQGEFIICEVKFIGHFVHNLLDLSSAVIKWNGGEFSPNLIGYFPMEKLKYSRAITTYDTMKRINVDTDNGDGIYIFMPYTIEHCIYKQKFNVMEELENESKE